MDLLAVNITDARSGRPLAGLEANLRCTSHRSDVDLKGISQADGRITHWCHRSANPQPSLATFVEQFRAEVTEWELVFDMIKRFGPSTWPLAPVNLKLQKGATVKATLTIERSTCSLLATPRRHGGMTPRPEPLARVAAPSLNVDTVEPAENSSDAQVRPPPLTPTLAVTVQQRPTSPMSAETRLNVEAYDDVEEQARDFFTVKQDERHTPPASQRQRVLEDIEWSLLSMTTSTASTLKPRAGSPREADLGLADMPNTEIKVTGSIECPSSAKGSHLIEDEPPAIQVNNSGSKESVAGIAAGLRATLSRSVPHGTCIMEYDNVGLNMACIECRDIIHPYMTYCRHSHHPRDHHVALFKNSGKQEPSSAQPELFTLTRSPRGADSACILETRNFSLSTVCTDCQNILQGYVTYSHRAHLIKDRNTSLKQHSQEPQSQTSGQMQSAPCLPPQTCVQSIQDHDKPQLHGPYEEVLVREPTTEVFNTHIIPRRSSTFSVGTGHFSHVRRPSFEHSPAAPQSPSGARQQAHPQMTQIKSGPQGGVSGEVKSAEMELEEQDRPIDCSHGVVGSGVDRELMHPPQEPLKTNGHWRSTKDLSTSALVEKLQGINAMIERMIQRPGIHSSAIGSGTDTHPAAPPPTPVDGVWSPQIERRKTLRRRGGSGGSTVTIYQNNQEALHDDACVAFANVQARRSRRARTLPQVDYLAGRPKDQQSDSIDKNPEHSHTSRANSPDDPRTVDGSQWDHGSNSEQKNLRESDDVTCSPSVSLVTEPPLLPRSGDRIMEDHSTVAIHLPGEVRQKRDRTLQTPRNGLIDTSNLPRLSSFDRLPSPISRTSTPNRRLHEQGSRRIRLPGIQEFDRLAALAPLPTLPPPPNHPQDNARRPQREPQYRTLWRRPIVEVDGQQTGMPEEEQPALEILASVAESRITEMKERDASSALSTPPSTSQLTPSTSRSVHSFRSSPVASPFRSLSKEARQMATDMKGLMVKMKAAVESTKMRALTTTAAIDASRDVSPDPDADSVEDCIMVDAPKEIICTPCIVQRKDGHVVKLVCPDCHEENFSAVRDFINHCRISHNRKFRNHEQAAAMAGELIRPTVCRKRKGESGKEGAVVRRKTRRRGTKRQKR